MNFRIASLSTFLAAAAALTPSLMLAKSKTTVHDRDAVLAQIIELRDNASDLSNNADRLQMLARDPKISYQSQASELERLKEDVNAMAKELDRLETVYDSAQPWERKAIDESIPLLKEVAQNTQAAILFLNGHQNVTWLPEYTAHVNTIADKSDALSTTLDAFVRFAKVHTSDDKLEKSLGLTD